MLHILSLMIFWNVVELQHLKEMVCLVTTTERRRGDSRHWKATTCLEQQADNIQLQMQKLSLWWLGEVFSNLWISDTLVINHLLSAGVGVAERWGSIWVQVLLPGLVWMMFYQNVFDWQEIPTLTDLLPMPQPSSEGLYPSLYTNHRGLCEPKTNIFIFMAL